MLRKGCGITHSCCCCCCGALIAAKPLLLAMFLFLMCSSEFASELAESVVVVLCRCHSEGGRVVMLQVKYSKVTKAGEVYAIVISMVL